VSERERAKPFVAWVGPTLSKEWSGHFSRNETETYSVPVVMTPLLPDDPRPGETWLYKGMPRKVLSAPFMRMGRPHVATEGVMVSVSSLRRPPAFKTYRFMAHNGARTCVEIVAESREEAVRKLAESLEEVTP